MNYIEIFLEALSAEKGRSPRTLASYASDLNHANDTISGGLMDDALSGSDDKYF